MLRILCSLLLACSLLSGCVSPIVDTQPKLPAGMEDTSDTSMQDMYEKLSSEKVTVISMGDSYMISIPSSILFYKNSPKMKWSCYDLLDDVIVYLRSYRKIIVKVTAYSEYCQSKPRTTVLTEERAKVLGKYLWSQEIGTGMVFTAGAGNDKPITSPRKECSDTSRNSRVEIVFRQITA